MCVVVSSEEESDVREWNGWFSEEIYVEGTGRNVFKRKQVTKVNPCLANFRTLKRRTNSE